MTHTHTSRSTEPVVIFLHIPKAAGTTLRMVMKRDYDPDSIYSLRPDRCPHDNIEKFKNLPIDRLQKIDLIAGHIGFGYGIEGHLTRPYTYVTMLRDPVQRVVSHYRYIRNMIKKGVDFSNRPWFEDAATMSLNDYVRYGRSGDLRNGQTKFLAGALKWWGPFDDIASDQQLLLEKAKENLRNHFIVIGLTERFDESVVLMKRALAWKKIPVYRKHNVSKGDIGVSTESLRLIQRYNEVDCELYTYAESIFERSVQAQGASFARELRRLQFVMSCYTQSRRVLDAIKYRIKK